MALNSGHRGRYPERGRERVGSLPPRSGFKAEDEDGVGDAAVILLVAAGEDDALLACLRDYCAVLFSLAISIFLFGTLDHINYDFSFYRSVPYRYIPKYLPKKDNTSS